MNSKDTEFLNKFLSIFRNVSKVIEPLNKEGKSTNPLDIAQDVMEFIIKMVDGVAVEFKGLPKYMVMISEINRDAQRAFDDKRYSDYIMLKYKGAEIFYKSFYQELFNKEIKEDDQLNLTEIIKEIEHNLNINSGILKELNDWRVIRNKIVHEHHKVNRKKAEEAKQFFIKLYNLFETYIKEMKKS